MRDGSGRVSQLWEDVADCCITHGTSYLLLKKSFRYPLFGIVMINKFQTAQCFSDLTIIMH